MKLDRIRPVSIRGLFQRCHQFTFMKETDLRARVERARETGAGGSLKRGMGASRT
jgi:hypothetical protein